MGPRKWLRRERMWSPSGRQSTISLRSMISSLNGANRLARIRCASSSARDTVAQPTRVGMIVPRLNAPAGADVRWFALNTTKTRPPSFAAIQVPPLVGSIGISTRLAPARHSVGGSAGVRVRSSSRLQTTRSTRRSVDAPDERSERGRTVTVHIAPRCYREEWQGRARSVARPRCRAPAACARRSRCDGSCATQGMRPPGRRWSA